MQTGKLIYVIEDDKDVCTLVQSTLEEHGYEVCVFNTGADAKRELKRRQPDLCIVDLVLPDIGGLTLVQDIWKLSRVGIFILTGLGGSADRVLGLEIGADDYITKPFEPRELVARINSYFRRISKTIDGITAVSEGTAHFMGRTFDPGTLSVTDDAGNVESHSAKEAGLLFVFLRSPNQVISRDQLLNLANPNDLASSDRRVDICISRIRKKIADDPKNPTIIKTIYGAGYLLACKVNWSN
ncbi:MAG: response regulator transcription factor [Magnetovibrio sp.]|nr:response regulator transcription factor [Magnetovibrio sp.]